MSLKDDTTARLASYEVLSEVFAVRLGKRPALATVAERLEAEPPDVDGAAQAAQRALDEISAIPGAQAAIAHLVRDEKCDPAYLAIFARAGFDFLLATEAPPQLETGRVVVQRGSAPTAKVFVEWDLLIVGYTDPSDSRFRQSLLDDYPMTPVKRLAGLDAERFRVTGRRPLELCGELMIRHEGVSYAEPELIEPFATSAGPAAADIHSAQWQHGVIETPIAWNKATGAGVRIAIVDVGFDPDHTALAASVNQALSGWYGDPLLGSPFASGINGMPHADHGTKCAGMAGGRVETFPDAGVDRATAGVAFDAELRLVAAVTDQVSTQPALAEAIAFAGDPTTEIPLSTEPGADIISCSFNDNDTGDFRLTTTLQAALDKTSSYRSGKGSVVVWAVSNVHLNMDKMQDLDQQVVTHPNVIAIGRSTDADDMNYTAFGAPLDFLAPGVNVLMPNAGDPHYVTDTGTSFACPCAAGVAALMLEVNPSLTAPAVFDRIRASCDRIGDLATDPAPRLPRWGYGRVNAARAVEVARWCPALWALLTRFRLRKKALTPKAPVISPG